MQRNKKSVHFVFAMCLLMFALTGWSQTADERIGKLMNEQDMFTLRTEHDIMKEELSPLLDAFARAMLAEAFNNPQQAYQAINELMNNKLYAQQLGVNNIAYLVYLKATFLQHEFRYEEAFKVLDDFLSVHSSSAIEPTMKRALSDMLKVCQTLAKEPATRLNRPRRDVKLDYTVKRAGKGIALYLDTQVNGKDAAFCLDTGNPKLSIVTRRFADEHGVRLLQDSVPMKGVGLGYARLGIAEELKLGDITFYNPLFYVVDQISPIDTLPLEAVFGSELLNALGELHFFPQEQKLIIPRKPKPSHIRNMQMKGQHLFVQFQQDTTNMLMHFDTGAARSNLTQVYFGKNMTAVEQQGEQDTIRLAGFGGVSEQYGYVLPEATFSLSGTSFSMNDLSVYTTDVMLISAEEACFGADFLQQFKKVTLSYTHMYLKVE